MKELFKKNSLGICDLIIPIAFVIAAVIMIVLAV